MDVRTQPRWRTDAEILECLDTVEANTAVGELVARHGGFALRVASSVLAPFGKAARSAAEEVAWDALTTVYAKRRRFDPAFPFVPWLTAVVRNRAYSWLRARRRYQPLDPAGLVAAEPQQATTDKASWEQLQEALDRAVTALPPRERDLFYRFYREGASVTDLACSSGLAAQTIRGLLSRAKKRTMARLGCVRLTNAQLKLLCRGGHPTEAVR